MAVMRNFIAVWVVLPMLRFFYWPAVGSATIAEKRALMQNAPIASAIKTLEIATQELQEIIAHAQENASGNYLKTREVFRDLHRAARELKEAGD